ncbi:MAG: hypothetical protein L3K10_03525 [Thermoplasmata archaeon]|nr:hypothetical protein [Thermoplasmata archaeon]
MTKTSTPARTPESSPRHTGYVDSHGRYHDRGKISAWNLGAYGFLIVLVLVIVHDPSGEFWVPYVLVALLLLLTGRYLSTRYVLDDASLRAFRILGGQRIALEDVTQIDYVSLRDLSPVGFFGSWGWRGRMWSPRVGTFDSIYTDTFGVLVTTTGVPLFVSPSDPAGFARELSRRVRSFTGPLEVDVGDPTQQRAAPMPTF